MSTTSAGRKWRRCLLKVFSTQRRRKKFASNGCVSRHGNSSFTVLHCMHAVFSVAKLSVCLPVHLSVTCVISDKTNGQFVMFSDTNNGR